MVFCYKCGTELPDQANFCFNCGVRTEKGVKVNVPMPYKEILNDMENQLERAFATASEEMKNAFNRAKEDVKKAANR
jgi:hypothetical protein